MGFFFFFYYFINLSRNHHPWSQLTRVGAENSHHSSLHRNPCGPVLDKTRNVDGSLGSFLLAICCHKHVPIALAEPTKSVKENTDRKYFLFTKKLITNELLVKNISKQAVQCVIKKLRQLEKKRPPPKKNQPSI